MDVERQPRNPYEPGPDDKKTRARKLPGAGNDSGVELCLSTSFRETLICSGGGGDQRLPEGFSGGVRARPWGNGL